MELREIGEGGIVSIISSIFSSDESVIYGIGEDDCAIIRIGDQIIALTTDTVREISDFPPQITDFEKGWMSAAVNLSDIASCGAEPFVYLMALSLPENMDEMEFRMIMKGINACLSEYNCVLVGGDLDRSDELSISGMALGTFPENKFLVRKGATPGDSVCITGTTGISEYVLKCLKEGIGRDELEDAEKLYMPEPKVREGRKILKGGFATAMTDISDSLAVSLHDVSRAGGIGFEVYEEMLPIYEPAVERWGYEEALRLALYGGGDFQLLFTSVSEEIPYPVIGKVVKEGIWLVRKNGVRVSIENRGYSHF